MKAKIIIVLLALVVLGSGAFFWWKANQPESLAEPQPISDETLSIETLLKLQEEGFYEKENKLIVKTGNVSITRKDGKEDEVATETTVEPGDEIEVHKGSLSEIQWFDGSVSRLAGGTKVTIQTAGYDPENISKTKINLFADMGEVWSKVVTLVDGESEFSILSANAIAGVRGSTFNYILEDGYPIVESVKHTAFVAKLDEEKEEKDTTILVGGQQATLEKEEVKVEEIPEEKLQDEWYAKNTDEDVLFAKKLKVKKMERIAKLAGPLPTDPDYKKKNKAIEKYLDAIEDPEEKATAELKIGQMRIYESVASANTEQLPVQMEQLSENIGTMEISDESKEALKEELKNELKVLDVALSDVLPDEEKLYEAKEIIREKHVKLETDPAKQQKAKEKIVEHKLYDLIDLTEKEGVDPELIEKEMENYKEKIEEVKEGLEEQDTFRRIHHQMLDQVLDKPVSLEKIEELRGYFEKEDAEEKAEPATPAKAPEPVKTEPKPTSPPPPSTEPKETIKQEAPFYQGESVHVPEPYIPPPPSTEPKETIRQEAPFHQGPSN